MDYKRIEQLLERYWNCETSVEEENELRAFFAGDDIPGPLRAYKDIFVYQSRQQEVKISPDFDARMLHQIEEAPVKIRKVSYIRKVYPFMRAAVIIGVFLALSNVVQHSMFKDDVPMDYNYDAYTDTYTDPEVAYETVSSALMILSEGLNNSQAKQSTDSLRVEKVETVGEQ